MTVDEIMTADFETMPADTSLRSVAQKMRVLDVGVMPLQEDDKVVGLVTDRDLVVRGIANGLDPDTTPAREVMTDKMLCVSKDASVTEAAELMEKNKVRRLVVMDEEEHVTGILSMADLALGTDNQCLAGETLEKVSEPGHPSSPEA